MKNSKIATFLVILSVLPLMAACGDTQLLPQNEEPSPNDSPNILPTEDQPLPPADQVDPTEDPVSNPLPPLAAVKARELLAAQLDFPLAEIEIISHEQAEWSDGCLGLGGPAESCLAAITPGWRVELSTGTKIYISRTDQLGDVVRFEKIVGVLPITLPPAAVDGSVPEAATMAQQALAKKIGIPVEKVEIVSFVHKEWPDGCLGLALKGMMCTMAIVPGWRIELSAEGKSFIARTDETGQMIKLE